MKTVLILGSNSDVGIATAYRFAKAGYAIQLATRRVDQSQLHLAKDLTIRFGVSCENFHFDAAQTDSHQEFIEKLPSIPLIVISVFGLLGDQAKASEDFTLANQLIQTNFLGNVSILGRFAQIFKSQKSGSILCLSSVAGQRGRKSNYLYGSSKAALTAYLSGLRADLYPFGVQVTTVIPGFIKTKMIGDLKTPAPLTASAEEVASAIFTANERKKDVVYVKGIWFEI